MFLDVHAWILLVFQHLAGQICLTSRTSKSKCEDPYTLRCQNLEFRLGFLDSKLRFHWFLAYETQDLDNVARVAVWNRRTSLLWRVRNRCFACVLVVPMLRFDEFSASEALDLHYVTCVVVWNQRLLRSWLSRIVVSPVCWWCRWLNSLCFLTSGRQNPRDTIDAMKFRLTKNTWVFFPTITVRNS